MKQLTLNVLLSEAWTQTLSDLWITVMMTTFFELFFFFETLVKGTSYPLHSGFVYIDAASGILQRKYKCTKYMSVSLHNV